MQDHLGHTAFRIESLDALADPSNSATSVVPFAEAVFNFESDIPWYLPGTPEAYPDYEEQATLTICTTGGTLTKIAQSQSDFIAGSGPLSQDRIYWQFDDCVVSVSAEQAERYPYIEPGDYRVTGKVTLLASYHSTRGGILSDYELLFRNLLIDYRSNNGAEYTNWIEVDARQLANYQFPGRLEVTQYDIQSYITRYSNSGQGSAPSVGITNASILYTYVYNTALVDWLASFEGNYDIGQTDGSTLNLQLTTGIPIQRVAPHYPQLLHADGYGTRFEGELIISDAARQSSVTLVATPDPQSPPVHALFLSQHQGALFSTNEALANGPLIEQTIPFESLFGPVLILGP